MFEDYLQDANDFLTIGVNSTPANGNEAKRYYRASVFFACGAMEAFINYIADSFAKARNLTQHETCFLNDKVLVFSVQNGLRERTEFHKLDDKIHLLMQKFVPEFDFTSLAWVRFMELKSLRDSLVHPRQLEDETTLEEYHKRVSSGLKAIIEIMNYISKGIYHQPLRRGLLDLIPE